MGKEIRVPRTSYGFQLTRSQGDASRELRSICNGITQAELSEASRKMHIPLARTTIQRAESSGSIKPGTKLKLARVFEGLKISLKLEQSTAARATFLIRSLMGRGLRSHPNVRYFRPEVELPQILDLVEIRNYDDIAQWMNSLNKQPSPMDSIELLIKTALSETSNKYPKRDQELIDFGLRANTKTQVTFEDIKATRITTDCFKSWIFSLIDIAPEPAKVLHVGEAIKKLFSMGISTTIGLILCGKTERRLDGIGLHQTPEERIWLIAVVYAVEPIFSRQVWFQEEGEERYSSRDG